MGVSIFHYYTLFQYTIGSYISSCVLYKKRHILMFLCILSALPFSYKGFALGTREDDRVQGVDTLESLSQDPILNQSIYRKAEKTKPSIEYLERLTKAKEALRNNDHFVGLSTYKKLQEDYGNNIEILFGLGESYFLLGDINNARLFYDLIEAQDDGTGVSQEIINTHYRLAYISYQRDDIDNYLEKLRTIIALSDQSDDSIVPFGETKYLDEVFKFFTINHDFSYVARREMGVYLAYKDRVSEASLAQLLTSLAMAVNSLSTYLSVVDVGYEFDDMFHMIELLKSTKKETQYLNAFQIVRPLIALQKYYKEQGLVYLERYCRELLQSLSHVLPVGGVESYVFYPQFE